MLNYNISLRTSKISIVTELTKYFVPRKNVQTNMPPMRDFEAAGNSFVPEKFYG